MLTSRWQVFSDLLLENESEQIVDSLIDKRVLSNLQFPTYGHDTKHAAARDWFLREHRPLARRTLEDLLQQLAVRITGIDHSNIPHFEMLAGSVRLAHELDVSHTFLCLTYAARAAFGDVQNTLDLEYDNAYRAALRHDERFAPLIAHSLYNRAIAKGQRGDEEGEVADYTAVIRMRHAPVCVIAKALNNRGATLDPFKSPSSAIADFSAVITMSQAPLDQIATAYHHRAVVQDYQGNRQAAIGDYSVVIAMPNAPVELVAAALIRRGIALGRGGDVERAKADYGTVINLPEAPIAVVTQALHLKGIADDAWFEDDTDVLGLSNTQPNVRAVSLREIDESTDSGHGSTDIVMVASAPKRAAVSLFIRGLNRNRRGEFRAAIADYTAVIELRGAPASLVARARIDRGAIKGVYGDREGEIADYVAVVSSADAPSDLVDQARRKLVAAELFLASTSQTSNSSP